MGKDVPQGLELRSSFIGATQKLRNHPINRSSLILLGQALFKAINEAATR
jgi:hypothetical protein